MPFRSFLRAWPSTRPQQWDFTGSCQDWCSALPESPRDTGVLAVKAFQRVGGTHTPCHLTIHSLYLSPRRGFSSSSPRTPPGTFSRQPSLLPGLFPTPPALPTPCPFFFNLLYPAATPAHLFSLLLSHSTQSLFLAQLFLRE